MTKEASPTLDELFAQAFAEDESATQEVAPEPEVPVELEVSEQADDDVPAKLSDIFGQANELAPSTSAVDLATRVTLPDGTETTIKDLIDGNMMRKDYTQKTQKLSAANELYEMLQNDPQGTIMALAQQAGINLDEEATYDQLRKSNKNVSSILKTDDDKLAAKVREEAQKLYMEMREQDPVFRSIAAQDSLSKVQAELTRIEKTYGYTLDDSDRQAIVKVAVAENQPNLEYIFLRGRAALEAKQAEKKRVADGALKKTAGSPGATKADVAKVRPTSIDEAFDLAVLQHANT